MGVGTLSVFTVEAQIEYQTETNGAAEPVEITIAQPEVVDVGDMEATMVSDDAGA